MSFINEQQKAVVNFEDAVHLCTTGIMINGIIDLPKFVLNPMLLVFS